MRSGKDLFVYNPDLFVDDDNVMNVDELEPEKDEVGAPYEMIIICRHRLSILK